MIMDSMHRPIYFIFVLFCSLLVISALPAAANSPAPKRISLPGLFSQLQVTDIQQTPLGEIAVINKQTLILFDGSKWQEIGQNEGLPFESIGTTHFASPEEIWITAKSPPIQLSRVSDQSVNTIELPLPDDSYFFEIKQQWLANWNEKPALLVRDPDNILWLYHDNEWNQLGQSHGLGQDVCLNKQSLYFTNEEGTYRIDAARPELKNFLFRNNGTIRWLSCKTSQPAYYIYNHELFLLEDTNRQLLAELPRHIAKANHLALYDRSHLLADSGQQLILWNFMKHIANHMDSDSSGQVMSSPFVDREGNIWLADKRELLLFRNISWQFSGPEDGLTERTVSALGEDASGRLIAGHNGAVSLLGEKVTHYPFIDTEKEQVPSRVVDILSTGRGNWLAAQMAGLYFMPTEQPDNIRKIPWPDSRTLLCKSLAKDKSGTLWVATNNALYFLDANQNLQAGPGLPEDIFIRKIRYDRTENKMVILTRDRLLTMGNDGQVSSIENWPDASYKSYHDYLRSSYYGELLATENGIAEIINGKTTQPSNPDLVLDESVYFLIEDESNILWASTDSGLSAYNGRAWLHYPHVTNGSPNIYKHALQIENGSIWFASHNGLVSHQPNEFDRNLPPPLIKTLNIEVNGEKRNDHLPLELAHEENNLRFEFSAISFLQDQLTYQFKLAGFETAWQNYQSSPDAVARYPNLDPGEYRFQVRAGNNRGVWSMAKSSHVITISRPFWQQIWFYIIALVAMLSVMIFIQRVLLQRAYSRDLESKVNQQTWALRRSQNQFKTLFESNRAILESMKDAVVSCDTLGRIILMNHQAEELAGLDSRNVVGEKLANHFHVSGTDDKTEDSFTLLKSTLDKPGELLLHRKNKPPIPIAISASAINNSENMKQGYVWVFRDITDEKNFQNQKSRAEKLEAVGHLAGGIAHDFNNLLMVILGNVSMLEVSAELEPDELQLIEEAEDAVLKAKNLTLQLLAFSKGGDPVKTFEKIESLCEDATHFTLSGSAVSVSLSFEQHLPAVFVDRGQMLQVLNNLLINARQAMDNKGEVHIKGKRAETLPAGLDATKTYLCIELIDNGPGMEESLVEQIFDPFFTTRSDGIGLGLATAYSIVQKHSGFIDVKSHPGEGSIFTLYLPAAEHGEESLENPATDLYIGKGRVLVMDDQATIRATLSKLLSKLGFEVVSCPDGEQAISEHRKAIAAKRPFDLMIFDLTIPGGMGGKDAMAAIRDSDLDTPSLVMSGYTTDPVLGNYLDYGFTYYLQKPFDVYKLSIALKSIFEK